MPKKIKPVLAWCVLGYTKSIKPGWCCDCFGVAKSWRDMRFDGEIIRVEIRPAPKRRKTQRRRK